MIERIKTWLWKRRLKQDEKQVSRKLASVNIENAKHIGLIAYINDEKHLKAIEDYAQKLKDQGKNVDLIVFTPEKEVPHYCMPKIHEVFVPQKMVNWYKIPAGKPVKSFQQKHFDILIDLCLEHYKETLYMVATSSATMRVGLYDEKWVKYYDLMISDNDNDKINLMSYIQEVEKYLNQINAGNHE